MLFEFQEVPYQQWGPWLNRWGYVTYIADFGDDILVRSHTPYQTKLVRYFTDWEDCERFIDLIEQDRRF